MAVTMEQVGPVFMAVFSSIGLVPVRMVRCVIRFQIVLEERMIIQKFGEKYLPCNIPSMSGVSYRLTEFLKYKLYFK
jgi:hypothetical protein